MVTVSLERCDEANWCAAVPPSLRILRTGVGNVNGVLSVENDSFALAAIASA